MGHTDASVCEGFGNFQNYYSLEISVQKNSFYFLLNQSNVLLFFGKIQRSHSGCPNDIGRPMTSYDVERRCWTTVNDVIRRRWTSSDVR